MERKSKPQHRRGEEETQERKVRRCSQVFITNLEDVVSRLHICDIDPLAVDLGVIGVVASRTQTLHVGHRPAGYQSLHL